MTCPPGIREEDDKKNQQFKMKDLKIELKQLHILIFWFENSS